MTDDLVKRMRNSGSRTEVELHEDREEAADRIEADAKRIAELEAALDAAAAALNRVAWGGDFICFVDAEWKAVNDALDTARAALVEKNE